MNKKILAFTCLIVLLLSSTILVACGKKTESQENDLVIDTYYQNYYGHLEVTFKNPEAIKELEFKVDDNNNWSFLRKIKYNLYEIALNLVDVNTDITLDIRKSGYDSGKIYYSESGGLKDKINFIVKPCLSYNKLHDITALPFSSLEILGNYNAELKILDDNKKSLLTYRYYEGNDFIEDRFYKFAIVLENDKIVFKKINITTEEDTDYYYFTAVSPNVFKVAASGITSSEEGDGCVSSEKTYTWHNVPASGISTELVTYVEIPSSLPNYDEKYSFFVMLNETPNNCVSLYNNSLGYSLFF